MTSNESPGCTRWARTSYRDILRSYVPEVYFVFLDASPEILAERLAARDHDFMPASLLDSQLATLEPLGDDEHGVRVDVTPPLAEIVRLVISRFG